MVNSSLGCLVVKALIWRIRYVSSILSQGKLILLFYEYFMPTYLFYPFVRIPSAKTEPLSSKARKGYH
jgi:hypothetical protein